MAEEFKVIETQEDFDKAIQKRLAQKDREAEEKYKDYLAPDKVSALKEEYEKKLADANDLLTKANEKIASHDQIVSELTTRATTAESDLLKSRIAHESGVPFELAGRLVGSNEEELRADASQFASFLAPKAAPPLSTGENGSGTSSSNAGLAQMLAGINAQFQNQT